MDINFNIHGSDLQYIEITLEPQQSFIAEQGAMMYVDDGIEVNAILGDGSVSSFGALGRFFNAFKRSLTGESFFSNKYYNPANSAKKIHIAAPSPGKIIPVNLADYGGAIICQKGAYLAGNEGLSVALAFQKKMRVGFFGGEGFIMQKISGNGIVFIHASGSIKEITLGIDDALKIDSGCLVGLAPSVRYDIKYTGKLMTSFFGGEGFFYATVTGPGHVWIQSLPLARLSRSIISQTFNQKGGGIGKVYLVLVVVFVLISIFLEL